MDDGLWQRPALLAALAAEDYGAVLRAWRQWTGASQSRAAALCGLAQPDVSAIEHGHRTVTSAAVQRRILDGLGVPQGIRPVPGKAVPAPLQDPRDRSVSDQDEAQALELARRVGASDIGGQTLDLLESAFDDLATDYATTPPHLLIERLRVHLAYVGRLLDTRKTLAEHKRLLVVGGWFSLLAATVHIDMKQPVAATARLRTASGLAEHAEHAEHAEIRAWALETSAWRAVTGGNFDRAVQLSRAAQAVAPAGSSAQTQATAQEGRALARLGDAAGVYDAMDRVHALVAARPEPDRPGHHYVYDPTKFTAYAGTTLAWLGDPAAEQYARGLIARLSGTEAKGVWPRRVASARLDLALVLLKSDQLDEAADNAQRAISSGHVAPSNYWRALEVVTAAEARGLPEAVELREGYETLRTSRRTA